MTDSAPNVTIRTIIFDFGGVLAKVDHMKACRALEKYSDCSASELFNLIFKSGIEDAHEIGTYSAREFWKKLSALFKSELTFSVFCEIWGDIFLPNLDIEKVVHNLSRKYRLVLLSNTEDIHWSYISMMPIIQTYFSEEERLVLSFDVKARKPSSEIFNVGIEKALERPEKILYVDDNKDYVQSFKRIGVHGIVYDCRNDGVNYLLRELRKLGINARI